MRTHFLKYLADPITGEDLTIEITKKTDDDIIEGYLVSKNNRYKIVRGIPRFAGYKDIKNYTDSFSYQWNKWSRIQFDSKNIGKPYQEFSLYMFECITGSKTRDLTNKVIADFGCGPGRFIENIRDKKGIAIGLDLSDAVEAAGEIFKNDPNVLICQADILHSPLKKNSIDETFSIGVLHHTIDPQMGFTEMIKATKPSGHISVSVYSTGGYYDNFIVNIWRKIFKKLWPIFGHYPPLIYSYIVVYISTGLLRIPILRTITRPFLSFIPSLILRDIRWSILNTFDSITPSNQYGFTPYQLFQWFKSANLKNIEPSNWAGSSFTAIK